MSGLAIVGLGLACFVVGAGMGVFAVCLAIAGASDDEVSAHVEPIRVRTELLPVTVIEIMGVEIKREWVN